MWCRIRDLSAGAAAGVVGVSASGAQVYEYNSFGPEQTFSMTLVVDAWEDCIAELDDRKAKTGMKDMKMVSTSRQVQACF